MFALDWKFDVELDVARKEVRLNAAENLLRLDRLTVGEIAETTSLTVDDVLKLKGNM